MRIAIIGAGRMGAWLAKELSAGNEVAAYDIEPREIPGTRRLQSLTELKEYGAELLVNAVTLQNTLAVFEEILPYLSSDCIISDIASVKTGLPEFYARTGRKFVSVHPMFGPTFAALDAVREENAIVIKESDRDGAALFVGLFARLGIRVFEFSFAEHDQMMAYSLTTPFVATMVFAACVDRKVVPGTTFGRHMKIAKGLMSEDDHLLAEVLFNPFSVSQIEKITAKLEFLKHVIRARDTSEAKKLFAKLRENISGT